MLTLYDGLMLVSILCVILMTGVSVYFLNRLRQKVKTQTIEVQLKTEQLCEIPHQLKEGVVESVEEVKSRLRFFFWVVNFVKRRKTRRRLKKKRLS